MPETCILSSYKKVWWMIIVIHTAIAYCNSNGQFQRNLLMGKLTDSSFRVLLEFFLTNAK